MKICEKQAWKACFTLAMLSIVLFLFTGCNSDIKDADSMIREADEMEMIYIPAGEFTMGSQSGITGHQVYLDGYSIDQHEVTNGQYSLCVEDDVCSPPVVVKSATREFYYGNSEFDHFPVIYVTWEQANDYCQWAGGALPTEAQWEMAAAGDSRSEYPWGDDSPDCDLLNYGKCVMDTSEVGAYPGGNSPYGLSDMAGNVSEWVADWFQNDYYKDSPSDNPPGPEDGEMRSVRGGAWVLSEDYGFLRVRYRDSWYPQLMNNQIGFRCVVNDEVADVEAPVAEAVAEEEPTVEPTAEVLEVETTTEQVTVWQPYAYLNRDRELFLEYMDEFNQEHDAFEAVVDRFEIQEASEYDRHVEMAAASGQLPCLFQLSANHLYQFADDGLLMPIEGAVSQDLVADMVPSVIDLGTYQGELYGLSQDELGFGIWANRSLLEMAGVRIPTGVEDAWTVEEFEQAMEDLKNLPQVNYPLDINLNWSKEWYAMSVYPMLRSFGGDILDTETMKSSGVLDSEASIQAMELLQHWVEDDYIDPDSVFYEDFVTNQTTAMVLAGNWAYDLYQPYMGDYLVLIPMPDFGSGQATRVGDWSWVISHDCANPGGAVAFLEYLMEPTVIDRSVEFIGMMPSRLSVIEQPDSDYRTGSSMEIFTQQLESGVGVVLPKVPQYQEVVEVYSNAMELIVQGVDVESVLMDAAANIDRILEENQ